MNVIDHGPNKMRWKMNSEIDKVTRAEVKLSDDVMSCKQAWWTWINIFGAKWKVNTMKSKTESRHSKNPIYPI